MCELLGQSLTRPFHLRVHSQVGCGHGLGISRLGHLAGLLQKRLQEELQRSGSGASRRTREWGPRPHKATPGCLPPPRSSTRPVPERIQMMTGTAAATFPISSSVCIIFLIRAWGEGRTLGPHCLYPRKGCWGKRVGIPGKRGRGGHGCGVGTKGGGASRPPNTAMRPPPSGAWARASPGLGPLLTDPNTCSPAGTARCTSSSCSASPGLSRRAGPSAAARSLPAPGPARRPPPAAEVPPGPGAARLTPAAPHWVLAPPVWTPLSGPECPPSEPPRQCALVRDSTSAPAGPQGQKSER